MNSKNHISDQEDDFKKIAPHLSKINASNPFKASDDYFEKFASEIKNRVTDFEEIKEAAPTLVNTNNYNPFETPATYFDEFPTIIQQRIIDNKSSSSILEWLILLIKPRFAIPVIATILFAVAGINFMNKHAQLPKTEVAEETSTAEQLYNIDEATIIEKLTAETSAENENISTDESSIKNYLIENNIDENNLNTEL